jgi:hypothetical protein
MPMFPAVEMVIQSFSAMSALISRIRTPGAVQLTMKIIRACQPHFRSWSCVTARLVDFAALLKKPRVLSARLKASGRHLCGRTP